MINKSIILLMISIFALIVSGCVSEETSPIEETNCVAEEYQKHVDTYEKDAKDITDAIENWNAALTMAESDEYISDDELLQLTDIANDYTQEMNLANPHFDSFYEFIEENEMELKEMSVDTYQDKKDITDAQTTMMQSYDNMAYTIEG